MRVDMKLHKNYDIDLLHLHLSGVSMGRMVVAALSGYVNGKTPHVFVPEYKSIDLRGVKRYINVGFEIKDPECIRFLKDQIRPGMRSSFLKTLVRRSLVFSPDWFCLKEDLSQVNKRLRAVDLSAYEDLVILTPERKRSVAERVLDPKGKYDHVIKPLSETKQAPSSSGVDIPLADNDPALTDGRPYDDEEDSPIIYASDAVSDDDLMDMFNNF